VASIGLRYTSPWRALRNRRAQSRRCRPPIFHNGSDPLAVLGRPGVGCSAVARIRDHPRQPYCRSAGDCVNLFAPADVKEIVRKGGHGAGVSKRGTAANCRPPQSVLDERAQGRISQAGRHRRRRRRFSWSAGVVTTLAVLLVGAQAVTGSSPVGAARQGARSSGDGLTSTRVTTRAQAYASTKWATPALLSGVSCTGSTCVAVGTSGASAGNGSETSPTGGMGQVLTSRTGGATWVPGSVPAGVRDLVDVICVTESDCIAVGQGTGGSTHSAVALLSENAGASWEEPTVPGSTLPLDAVSCQSAVVCAAIGEWPVAASRGSAGMAAVFSTDGGRTWSAAGIPPAIAGLSTISCTSSGFCLAGGEGFGTDAATGNVPQVIVASSDGGARWSQVAVPTGYFLLGHVRSSITISSIHCTTGAQCILTGLFAGTKSGDAFFTTNGGSSWEEAPGWQSATGDGPGAPSSVSCPSPTICLAVAMDFSFPQANLLISHDGGASWSPLVGPSGQTHGSGPAEIQESFLSLVALSCPSFSDCVVVGQGQSDWLFAAATSDAGTTWSPSQIPVPLGGLHGVSCWNARACLAVGISATRYGAALSTTDGGSVWRSLPVPPGMPPLAAVACPAPRQCIAVGSNWLTSQSLSVSTDDAGTTWRSTPFAAGTVVSALACPTPTACWVAGASGGPFGRGFLAFSHDSGRTWRRATLPAGVPGIAALSCTAPSHCLAVSSDAEGASAAQQGVVVLRLFADAPIGRWQRVGTIGPLLAPLGPGDSTAGSPDLLSCRSSSRCLLATVARLGPAPAWRGRVVATTDGGRTWKVAGRSPDNYQGLAGIACPRTDECIGVGGGAPNRGAGIITTSGTGAAPAVQAIPNGVGNLYGITCTSDQRCITVGTSVGAAALLVTNDHGQTWDPVILPAWAEGVSSSSG
jgi:hypothetical protein